MSFQKQVPYGRNDNKNTEEGFYESTKEINSYLLRFNDSKMEKEYLMFSINKYRQLGFVICIMQMIIFVTDFIHLFQDNDFPQNKLVFLIIMLVIAVFVFIMLYFKSRWFNIIYSLYYSAYIIIIAWSMYDVNSTDNSSSSSNNNNNNNNTDNSSQFDPITKVDNFSSGFVISAILTLGITGSNYMIKNLLFTCGSVLLYASQARQNSPQYWGIIRISLVILLYYYISYQREKAQRLSFLKQKQIDSYNNIMNNQIPHCLFAAKFNSIEQRIELFKCNSRAQKEFNVNGNEDFDRFISSSYLVQHSEKTDRTVASGNSVKQSQQQTWQNSLKGKIRQLIETKIQEQKLQQSNKDDSDTNNLKQNQNLNTNSPIIKLKLRQQDGIGSENKINVRLSIFKLHEYYVIITVDRNRKKKNKLKKEIKSKSGRNSILGTKISKQLTLENLRLPISNEIALQQTELHSPQRYSSSGQPYIINIPNDTQPLEHITPSAAPTQPNFLSQNNNSIFPTSLRQSPTHLVHQQQQQRNFNEEEHVFMHRFSPPNNSISYPQLQFQNNNKQNITSITSNNNAGNNTPTAINSKNNNGNSYTPQNNQNPDLCLNYTPITTNTGSQRKNGLNGRSVSTSNNYLNYMTQKKLSLSTMGVRKPMNSVNSAASTCLPLSSTYINQPRTTSFGLEQYQFNPRISQGSRNGNQNNFNFNIVDNHAILSHNNNNNNNNNNNQLMYQHNNQGMNNHHNNQGMNNHHNNQNSNINSNENRQQMKEQMLDVCFEIIASTIALIQRYKITVPTFKNSKISTYFMPSSTPLQSSPLNHHQLFSSSNKSNDKQYKNNSESEQTYYYEALEKYTSCIMQQILITNSNFMKFTRLIFNQVNLKYQNFSAQELIKFLSEQIQPILVEKSIVLYLQDDFDAQLYSDLNTLKLILINILIYSGGILNELEYLAVKLSLLDENSTLKVQISMPYHENHIFNHIDTLHQLSLEQIQKDYFTLHKFHIDLRVAFSMIKKLNFDNPNIHDYLKFSHAQPANNHMYLTFTVPIQINVQPFQSQVELIQFSTQQATATTIHHNHSNTAEFKRKSEEIIKLPDRDQSHFRQQNEFNETGYNHNHNNVEQREAKNTEECFLDDSVNSLERWVTIKQYTTRITDKHIKLIL